MAGCEFMNERKGRAFPHTTRRSPSYLLAFRVTITVPFRSRSNVPWLSICSLWWERGNFVKKILDLYAPLGDLGSSSARLP